MRNPLFAAKSKAIMEILVGKDPTLPGHSPLTDQESFEDLFHEKKCVWFKFDWALRWR